MQTIHKPDLDQARAFLNKLDDSATSWTFQTFDDDSDRKDQSLARVYHGTLDQHAASLADMQAKGAGVFVTVNETDGKGRKASNVTRIRALFLDLDGAPLDPVRAWEEPHIICETSPGRWHTYWSVKDCPLDAFKPAQKDLIAAFGGDKSVHDLPRVMRLPGFWHLKSDPVMVRTIETEAFPAPFTHSEFHSKLDAIKPAPKLSEQAMPRGPAAGHYDMRDDTFAGATSTCADEVVEILSYIAPDSDGYGNWLSVLMALHEWSGGSQEGLSIADDWSSRGPKYQPGEVAEKWQGFDTSGGTNWATVPALARANGADLSAIARKYKGRNKTAASGQHNGADRQGAISRRADRIAKTIAKRIRDSLPDLENDPEIDGTIIQSMIEGAFWSGVKSKIFLLNHDECLVQFGGQDAWKFLCRRFGKPVDVESIIEQVKAALVAAQEDDSDTKEMPQRDQDRIAKAVHAAVIDPILDYLKYENQRDQVEWSVDMFAKRAKLELKEDVVRIVLTHQPLDATGPTDQAVIDDYRAHFPQIDHVLDYIVAARFALDRKKAYLWLLAQSDWGKGFLMGALKDHGLVVEMSVREIEGIFEGKPAGRSPADFKRAMILAVDEFKAVKSELKQLQSEIYLAPKYQLTARVEIFTKLFLSAESVGSLVTENGVEDQFANRMSMITGAGTLNQRDLYQADQGRYYRVVKTYIARRLNKLIADYISLGRMDAEKRADDVLNAFIAEHGLDQHFQRLSDSYPDIATQAVEWLRHKRPEFVTYAAGNEYLQHANKALEDYLTEHFTFSEVGTLRRRKPEIMQHMSADGKGNAAHRVHGAVVKAVILK
jgi:hypothetical protein